MFFLSVITLTVPSWSTRGSDLLGCFAREAVLCFEELLHFTHSPVLLATTYCLAAGTPGGWHLLQSEGDVEETRGPSGDLWVWETDAWALQCCTLHPTASNIQYELNTSAERQSYVGSGLSPWWVVCVRYCMLCREGETCGYGRLAL